MKAIECFPCWPEPFRERRSLDRELRHSGDYCYSVALYVRLNPLDPLRRVFYALEILKSSCITQTMYAIVGGVAYRGINFGRKNYGVY